MKKRICCALLCAALTLALLPAGALAAAVPTEEEAAQVMAALEIMVGDQNGNLNLTNNITRAEFTKMAVSASSFSGSVGSTTSVSPYPDLPRTHWAAPAVQAAVEHGLVHGYTDGTFRPNRNITLAEGVTVALYLLGYTDGDFVGAFPAGQMNLYRNLKLDQGVSASTPETPITRRDAMYLFYNLMTTRTKTGQVYLTTLGHSLTPSGEIDRVALINAAMDGPTTADGSWQSRVGFDLATAKVYRGGVKTTLSAIQSGDVLYWSKPMRTVWAFTDKVTGTYQSASPSVSNPTAVTVAGTTYSIETAAAAFDLSDLGGHPLGSTVTLLLGRSGGVAAVLDSAGGAQSAATVYGVVTGLGKSTYTDTSGSKYSADTVTLMATDGRTYSYQHSTSGFSVGDVVKAAPVGAAVTVSHASSGSLSGVMNAEGTAIGSHKLAAGAAILETYGETGVRKVYPSRLAGVNLTGSAVRCYATNAAGEITDLILKDVTGDGHSYGVLTKVTESAFGMSLMAAYEYDLNGQSGAWQTSGKSFNVKTGPCGAVTSGSAMTGVQLERLYNLTAVELTSASTSSCVGKDGKTYRMGDNVAVYERSGGTYRGTTLSQMQGAGKRLTGYYDKPESEGGRIRVIVAQ